MKYWMISGTIWKNHRLLISKNLFKLPAWSLINKPKLGELSAKKPTSNTSSRKSLNDAKFSSTNSKILILPTLNPLMLICCLMRATIVSNMISFISGSSILTTSHRKLLWRVSRKRSYVGWEQNFKGTILYCIYTEEDKRCSCWWSGDLSIRENW